MRRVCFVSEEGMEGRREGDCPIDVVEEVEREVRQKDFWHSKRYE